MEITQLKVFKLELSTATWKNQRKNLYLQEHLVSTHEYNGEETLRQGDGAEQVSTVPPSAFISRQRN